MEAIAAFITAFVELIWAAFELLGHGFQLMAELIVGLFEAATDTDGKKVCGPKPPNSPKSDGLARLPRFPG
jgi:hypothetical protein